MDPAQQQQQQRRRGLREQEQYMPIANVIRIMRRRLPPHAKISDDAKECMQECVSEYISFITGEANDRCQQEQRKTVTADDILWAMAKLGFDDYVEPLTEYLKRYRQSEGDHRAAGTSAYRDPPFAPFAPAPFAPAAPTPPLAPPPPLAPAPLLATAPPANLSDNYVQQPAGPNNFQMPQQGDHGFIMNQQQGMYDASAGYYGDPLFVSGPGEGSGSGAGAGGGEDIGGTCDENGLLLPNFDLDLFSQFK
ncbi:Nuclear transcription factor Y subunit B-6 [Linum grandiflorum]